MQALKNRKRQFWSKTEAGFVAVRGYRLGGRCIDQPHQPLPTALERFAALPIRTNLLMMLILLPELPIEAPFLAPRCSEKNKERSKQYEASAKTRRQDEVV